MSYAGASYQITNDPNANSVIIRTISNNGISQFSSSVLTNGKGSKVPSTGDSEAIFGKGSTLTTTDPLFSQGSVVRYGNALFVVNAGSNTISMFNINPNNPVDISFVTIAPTFGEYPVSIAANSQHVAVLTGGNNSGINFYTWNSSSLTPLSNWNRNIQLNPPQSSPLKQPFVVQVGEDSPLLPSGPTNTVSDIIFSPDNNSVIVSYKGFNTTNPGGILIYPIQNGSLAENPVKSIPQGSALSFAMTPIENSALLVTDAAIGFSAFSYNSNTGESTAASTPIYSVPPQEGKAICWSTYSQQTENYYLVGASSSTVTEVNINSDLQSSIVKVYKFSTLGLTDANVLTINGQDYLYVNAPGNRSIVVMKLNNPGEATIVQVDSSLPSNITATGISGMTLMNTTSNNNDVAIWVWIILLIVLIILIVSLFGF